MSGRDSYLQHVEAAVNLRETARTDNNAKSSRGCALMEIRLKRGNEPKGVITLVDLMGKEDVTEVGKKEVAKFTAGAKNASALWDLLKDITNHKNRAASLITKSPPNTRPAVRMRSHPYEKSDLYHLVKPIRDGLVCGNGAPPYVAVIAHITDCKDNASRNLKTLKVMGEL